jgi:hypothetical protein
VHDGGETIEALGASNLEFFLLARLERFATVLADPQTLNDPAWHRLARHAAAAGFTDCLALGLRDEALVILRTPRGDLPRRA